MKFRNPLVRSILERYRRIWAIEHAVSLMDWDLETYMPPEGIWERAVARGELSVLHRELVLQEDFVSLVERAGEEKDLTPWEAGVVRVLRREIEKLRKIPPGLIYEMKKTTSEAFQAWKIAREKNDFGKFAPYLARIVELTREMAERLGYEERPYDALLDLHEEGLRTRTVERTLGSLEGPLRRILERVEAGDLFAVRHPLEDKRYDRGAMRRVNERVLDLLGFPRSRARMDVSPHPFTSEIGMSDVRITTRYEGFDFKRSLLSTVHEFGHALYGLQIDEELRMTPVGCGVGLGIDEGQSRFWENVVGRSPAFAEIIKPVLDEELGFTREYDPSEIYRYMATVRRGVIRTEADEVTYNLHIILRFRLELGIIEGELRVEDLPEVWEQESERLLGVRPASQAEGVLQDVHWSHGSIGYFPTYTLGNILASMTAEKMERELGPVEELLRGGRIEEMKRYLGDLVHRHGATYPPGELLRMKFGGGYEPVALLKYLERKYLGGA